MECSSTSVRTVSPPKQLRRRDTRTRIEEGENICLNLDWKQQGIGSSSCGPYLPEKYQIPAEPFRFGMKFRGFRPNELNDISFFKMI